MQFEYKPTRLLVFLSLILVHLTAAVNAQFTASSNSGCKPFNVQFTYTGVASTSYNWDFGNGTFSTQQNPVNVFLNAGTYNVTLTTSGPLGNSFSSTVITVVDGPVADFYATQLTACKGTDAIQFVNTSASFDSCVWDFGDGSTSTLVNPAHIYNLSGQFTVTLVVYDNSIGCSKSITKNQYINVPAPPVPAIQVNDTVTCDKAFSFQFTGSGANISAWQWNFGDGSISTLQNPSHVYNDTGYFDVTVIVTSSSGCSDTIVYPHFVHILFNEVPPIIPYFPGGCVPFRNSYSTTLNGVAQWYWNYGDGFSDSSAYIVYHTYNAVGNFIVNVNVKYTNGCENNNAIGPITVDTVPEFTFSIQNTIGCSPLTVQCINNNSNKPYSWKWYFGDGDSSSTATTSHTYTTDGVFAVSLIATNSAGCSWGYEATPKVIVTSPKADFVPDKTSGCIPLAVNFNNYSLNAGSYEWDFGDGSYSTAANPTHIYTTIGIYPAKLVVTHSNGCKDSMIVNINASLTGNSFSPLAPITACVPFTINFTDNSASSSWLWNFGDGGTSTLQNPSHTYTTPGTYNVSLSTTGSGGGCSQNISNLRTIIINGGVADFTHMESLCPPYTGYFADSSQNAVAWLWNFDDGGTSTLQNPVHVFGSPGYHSAGLTITTAQGCKVTVVKNLDIYFEPLTAATTTYSTDTVPPINVQFYSNTVGATYWHWDFGDGDTSNLKDPFHTFITNGPYIITLTIGNDSCSTTYTYQPQDFGSGSVVINGGGGNPPVIPIVYHCAPYEVSYSNPHPGANSWLWDFGDGTISTDQNPVHEYTTSGVFQVMLIVDLGGGLIDTLVLPEINYVDAFDGDFTITTTGACSNIIATLTPSDTTATCSWELGDGTFSNNAVPVHSYPLNNLNYLISLSATDSNGCSASSAQTFYLNNINPVLASAMRGCAGDTFQFENAGIGYASYLWDFGDGNSSTLENPSHVYNDSGAYIVTLTLFDSSGCSITYALDGMIQIFKPEAFFTVQAAGLNCSYSFELENLSTGYDYLYWDFGDGTTSTQPVQYVYYDSAGYYYISLTVSQSVCTSTYTYPTPVFIPDITADFTFTQTEFCSPVTQQFVDLSTDAVRWIWNFGDGTSDTVQNPVHVYHVPPISDVKLIVVDIFGCNSVITKPAPSIANAAFDFSSVDGCIPLTVQFTDTSSNAVSYFWDFGDGITSTDSTPVHIYNAPGAYDVTLIVGSSLGCSDTLMMEDLVYAGNVIADFTVDSLSGCAPFMVQFNDQSTNAVSWSWDFGDNSYSSLKDPAHIYNVPGVYPVSLIVFDSLGCSDTMQMVTPITINGSVPYFTVSSSNGCVPYTVSFDNLSTGAVSYEWNFGNGVTDTAFAPSYIYSHTGNYTVSLTTSDSSGCENIYTLSTPLTAGETPVADFIYSDSSGCTPYLPVIINKSLYADSLIWDFGDGTISNAVNPTHAYVSPGTYYISLYVFNASGCSDSLVNVGPFIVGATPVVSFMSDDSSGCAPTGIQFTNASSNLDQPVYYWDFGNGDTSNQEHPYEVFPTPGIYDVHLIVTNAGGCYNKLTVDNMIVIFDQSAPPATNMFSVSVDNSAGINVSWRKQNLSSIDYYIIYRQNNIGGYDSVGYYLNSASSPTIITCNDNVDVNIQSYTYKTLAIDHCGNSIDLANVNEHSSIFLSGVNNGSAVSLSWSSYGGCTVSGYRIYRSDAGQNNFQIIATVDANITFYNDLETYCPLIYNYRVEGIDICNDINATALSNTVSIDHTSYQWQQNVELTRATVVNNSYVLVEWNQPAMLPFTVVGYDVYKSTDHVNFNLLTRVSSNQLYYEDYSVSVDHANYYYKVVPVNYCDVIGSLSNEGSSILLKGVMDETGKVRLRWTSYSQWGTGVDHYILEKMNDYGVWEPLKTLDGATNEAED